MIPEPQNVDVPQSVIEAAIDGSLTIFLGNGLSRLYGFPSWDGLANSMLSELAKEKVITFNDAELIKRLPIKTKISIADSYFKENWQLEREKVRSLTYEAILSGSVRKRMLDEDKIFSHLARCKVRFVTTNYDHLLDTQLNKVHKKAFDSQNLENATSASSEKPETMQTRNFEIISHPSKLEYATSLTETVLLHLHGMMGSDEGRLIASTADYLDLYTDKNFSDCLIHFLSNQTIVFIGYGLQELEVLEMIFRASKLNDQEKEHLILLPLMSHEEHLLDHLERYWKALGFKLVAYNTDKKGYDSIEDLILKWAPVIAEEARPPRTSVNNEVIDSILDKFDEVSSGR